MIISKRSLSIFSVVLLLSTAILIPSVYAVNENENINTSRLGIFEKLKAIYEKFKHMWIRFRGYESLIGGIDIIEQCYEYYNNTEVRREIAESDVNLRGFIKNNYEEDANVLYDMFDIYDCFSLDGIYNRIRWLDPTDVIGSIHQLLDVPKSYNEFNDSDRNWIGKLFMMLGHNINFENMTGYFPIVDQICKAIASISLIWVIALTILFGVKGLIVSSFITYVFFAPITVPMSMFISMVACVEDENNGLKDDLVRILILDGLVGLFTRGVPKLFQLLFLSEYGLFGVTYVFNKISFASLIPTINYDYITTEVPPVIDDVYYYNNYANKRTKFGILVKDEDMVYWNGDEERRDYIKVGIDWDNDMIFDQWTSFKKDIDNVHTLFEVGHKFKKEGSYTVNFVAFDLMGAYSSIKSKNVVIEVSRSRFVLPPLIDLLKCLFFRKL